MIGDLLINGNDAWTKYRANLEDGSVFELITPLPKKEFVESNIRNLPGRIIKNFEQDDVRDLTLVFHIAARNNTESYSYYKKFADEVLAPGKFTISSKFAPGEYEMIYRNCTPISSKNGIIKFSVKLIYNCYGK